MAKTDRFLMKGRQQSVMHNNFTLDRAPKSPKAFYTVVEAAVQLARSEGAKSANDPRIKYYSELILDALESGSLRIHEIEDQIPLTSAMQDRPSATGESRSLSSAIARDELKQWVAKKFPNLHPAFLLGKKE